MKQVIMEFLRCTGFLKSGQPCPYRQKHGTKCGYHRRQK